MKRLLEGIAGFLFTGILGAVFIGILYNIGYLIIAPFINYKIDPRLQQVVSVLLFTLSFLGGYLIYRILKKRLSNREKGKRGEINNHRKLLD